jgi:hypothetical protein
MSAFSKLSARHYLIFNLLEAVSPAFPCASRAMILILPVPVFGKEPGTIQVKDRSLPASPEMIVVEKVIFGKQNLVRSHCCVIVRSSGYGDYRIGFAFNFLLFPRCFARDLSQPPLLLRRQLVFDTNEQPDMRALDLAFETEHFVQLSQRLRFIHLILFYQRRQLFNFLLQIPLQFREAGLRLAQLGLEETLLLFAQAERLLMLHDQFGWKEISRERVGLCLLLRYCSAERQ